MGVSKNRGGPPKWMVYKAKAYQNGWFGGTIIFGKHPYTISPSSSTNLRSSEYPALLGIKPGQDLENFANWNAWELGFSQLKYSWISWKKLNCPPVEQKLSADENGSAGKCRWLLKKMLFPRSWLKHLLKRTGWLLVVDKQHRNPKTPISYQLSQLATENMTTSTSQCYDDSKSRAAFQGTQRQNPSRMGQIRSQVFPVGWCNDTADRTLGRSVKPRLQEQEINENWFQT